MHQQRLPAIILFLLSVAAVLWGIISILLAEMIPGSSAVVGGVSCLCPCAAAVFGLPFLALCTFLGTFG
jgi:F0F1-type ATP synthase assembly protein I